MKTELVRATLAPALAIGNGDTINMAGGTPAPAGSLVPISPGKVQIEWDLPIRHLDATQEGGKGPDQLWGTAGNDVLHGNGGNDFFMLTGGSDRAYGGSGDDLFYIGAGAHQASGGSGADSFKLFSTANATLTGGSGADYYAVHDNYTGHAVITDFDGAGGDRIRFDKPVAEYSWNPHAGSVTYYFGDGGSLTVQGVETMPTGYIDFV